MSWSVIVDMPQINNKTHSHEFRYTIRLYNMIYVGTTMVCIYR